MKRGKKQGKIMALLLCGALVFSNLASSAVLAEDEPAGEAVQEEQVQEVHTHVEEPAPAPAAEVPVPAPVVEEPASAPAVEESESAPTSEPVPEPESEEVTPAPETEEAVDTANDMAEAEEGQETQTEAEAAPILQEGAPVLTERAGEAAPISDDTTAPVITVTPKKGTEQKTFDNMFYCDVPTVTVTDDSGGQITVTLNDGPAQEIQNGGTVSLEGRSDYKLTIKAKDASGNEKSRDIYLSHYPGGRYSVVIDATCTEASRRIMYMMCKYCGISYGATESKPDNPQEALGHQYDETEKQEITPCGGEKVSVSPCARCKVMVTQDGEEYQASEGHEWGETETVEPTCLQPGYQYRECSKCKIQEKTGETTKATGHRYGAWKEVGEEPECLKEGIRERTCLNAGCKEETAGHKQTEKYVKLHEYSSQRTRVREATCTEGAIYGYKCLNCDDYRMSYKGSPLGHDYSHRTSCTETVTCSRCTATLEGEPAHNLG